MEWRLRRRVSGRLLIWHLAWRLDELALLVGRLILPLTLGLRLAQP